MYGCIIFKESLSHGCFSEEEIRGRLRASVFLTIFQKSACYHLRAPHLHLLPFVQLEARCS